MNEACKIRTQLFIYFIKYCEYVGWECLSRTYSCILQFEKKPEPSGFVWLWMGVVCRRGVRSQTSTLWGHCNLSIWQRLSFIATLQVDQSISRITRTAPHTTSLDQLTSQQSADLDILYSSTRTCCAIWSLNSLPENSSILMESPFCVISFLLTDWFGMNCVAILCLWKYLYIN